MRKWFWFTDEEVEGLHEATIEKLDKTRGLAGIPLIITSGKRNPARNAKAGGAKNSAHLRGRAVDVRSRSSESHSRIIEAAYKAGFNRVGIYTDRNGNPSHIHLDDDPTLPPNRLWTGISK